MSCSKEVSITELVAPSCVPWNAQAPASGTTRLPICTRSEADTVFFGGYQFPFLDPELPEDLVPAPDCRAEALRLFHDLYPALAPTFHATP